MNEAILALCCLRFPALIRGEWTVAVLCATKGFSERSLNSAISLVMYGGSPLVVDFEKTSAFSALFPLSRAKWFK